MKKIHITEGQLNYIKSRMTEAYTVDLTKETEAANGNVKTAWDRETSKNPTLRQQAQQGEVNAVVNPEGIDEEMEGKAFTKRQIKEAKIKKLQENSVVFRKKDLR